MSILINFTKEDDGTTAIEYALIASLIFLVIVASFTALALKVEKNLYQVIEGAFS